MGMLTALCSLGRCAKPRAKTTPMPRIREHSVLDSSSPRTPSGDPPLSGDADPWADYHTNLYNITHGIYKPEVRVEVYSKDHHQWYPATIKDPATFPSPHGPVEAHQLLVEYDDTLGTGYRIGPSTPIRPLAPPPCSPNGPVG